MSTTSLSIVLTVFVLHLHHVGPDDRPVPEAIKRLFFHRLAPLLCMSSVTRYERKARRRRQRYDESRLDAATTAAADASAPNADSADEDIAAATSCNGGRSPAASAKLQSHQQQQYQQRPLEAERFRRRLRQYEQLQRHLRLLIRRQAEDEAAQLAIGDWRMLAFIVDRMLFWLFLFAAFVSTTVILVIMPLFKQVA